MRMTAGGYALIFVYLFAYWTFLEVQSSSSLFVFLFVDLGLIILIVRSALFHRTQVGAIILYMSSTIFSLLIFTHYYMSTGVMVRTETGSIFFDQGFFTCLYFSIITWTSLGYGDVSPTLKSRPWVMIEVFYGYIHMGVLMALILDFLKPIVRKPTSGRQTSRKPIISKATFKR